MRLPKKNCNLPSRVEQKTGQMKGKKDFKKQFSGV